jgi:parallel beta-helix repeat protein
MKTRRPHPCAIWTAAGLLSALPAISQGQTTIYVSPCGDDAWSGLSTVCTGPSGPKATIQAAILQAAPGDTVQVLQGTYSGPGNRDISFGGKAITVRGAGTVVIDVAGAAAAHARAFAFTSGEGAASILEGMSIRNGYATHGGAMLILNSSPQIRDCTFEANAAFPDASWRGGGAVFIAGGAPEFIDCRFEANHAQLVPTLSGGGGGAIWAEAATLSLVGCDFVSNSTTGAQELGRGGAVMISSGATADLHGCSFISNHSEASGGGMAVIAGAGLPSSASLTGCIFQGNTAFNAAGFVAIQGGTATLTNCDFLNNQASRCCAGITIALGTTAIIDGCTVVGNIAAGEGAGGILVQNSSTAQMSNCTVEGNSALFGGGLWIGDTASLIATNSTIASNSSTNSGGGVTAVRSAQVNLYNCLVQDNQSAFGGGVWLGDGAAAEIHQCVIADNTSSSNGAGILATTAAAAVITNSTIRANVAVGNGGGAMVTNNASGRLVSCLVDSNQAVFGGGVWVGNGGSASLINATLVRNAALSGGGGIRLGGTPAPLEVLIQNSILWLNAPQQISIFSGAAQVSNSNVQNGWPGNIATDPLFVDAVAGNFRLSLGSPCIDAANGELIPPGLLTDLDGNSRFVSTGLPPGSGTPDMGAYEYQGGSCYPNCDASTTPPILNIADFSCFLQKFAAGDPYANCDASTVPPILNVADFSCFLTSFAAGCP